MRRGGEIEGAREDEAMKWQEALADKDAAFAATLADDEESISWAIRNISAIFIPTIAIKRTIP
jgi:hypothetical protein